MKNANLFKKVATTGTLLTVGATALVYSNLQTVDAKSLPTATTKDYNRLQALSKKSGTHYVKSRYVFGANSLYLIIIYTPSYFIQEPRKVVPIDHLSSYFI